jgi:hypothetical protein
MDWHQTGLGHDRSSASAISRSGSGHSAAHGTMLVANAAHRLPHSQLIQSAALGALNAKAKNAATPRKTEIVITSRMILS